MYLARMAFIAVLALLVGPQIRAQSDRFAIGLGGGFARLAGNDTTTFPLQMSWGVHFTTRITERWRWGAGVEFHSMYDDSAGGSGWKIGGDKDEALLHWKATRVAGSLRKYLTNPRSRFSVCAGIDGGLMIWKFQEPKSDTVLKVPGPNNETIDYRATEIFTGGIVGVELHASPRVTFAAQFGADYLTGAGADFADEVSSGRDRWLMRSRLTLNYSFGGSTASERWRSEESWSVPIAEKTSVASPLPSEQADSDDDGVNDELDDCPLTPRGAIVDASGCPVDSDRDGIPDGLDHCSNTNTRAVALVDIYGCPVDTDFDGLPDYVDSCPGGPVGATVDESGCPIDSDSDGVPDGLDDCPNTLFGVAVDRYGCIELTMLAEPMVLHIDYVPGSFEIDPIRKQALESLARILLFVKDIKLEISGYTDNIGTATANQKLSEKRAYRVRDFLVSQGVETERIAVFGRGEANFVADNNTAEGRARNRRIEIVFYR